MTCLSALGRAVALVLLLATTACNTINVDLPARTATQIGTRIQFIEDRFGVCWPGTLDTTVSGDPVRPPGAGQMTAGYANHVRRGESCHTQRSRAYVAAFRFDLSDVSRSIIAGAYLHLDRVDTNLPSHVTHERPYGTVVETQCLFSIQIATEDVPAGVSHGRVSSVPISEDDVPLANGFGVVGGGATVTSAVQAWAIGDRPNWGFVIRPRPGAIDKNEDSCTGYWFNPRLTIRVVRPAP